MAIIGGGASGLLAAEILSARGHKVAVFERKSSLGRKFLMAGRGGLNLTHSEDIDTFISRYGAAAKKLDPLIHAFTPQDMRDWCEGLGEETFIGSSGRIFPKNFKASPLLRAWMARLTAQGVTFHYHHDWQGWQDDALVFNTPEGVKTITPCATLLSLGGASWPRLGADGSWVRVLAEQGVGIAPLRPMNCGFAAGWSEIFIQKFAGQPLKPVTLTHAGKTLQGEMMITERGVEGGAIYALSSQLRDDITVHGTTTLYLDLKPSVDEAALIKKLNAPRQRETMTNFLRKAVNLSPIAIGLLMETKLRVNPDHYDASEIAQMIKSYPLILTAPFSLGRAISTSGGVMFDAVDENMMLKNKAGVFIAGEMLDWEAPTGGYLLQGCFATGVHAAKGMMTWMEK
jgi:uncharacterized flavoprotein (TIGR03862 family)